MFQPCNGKNKSEGTDKICRLYPSSPPISPTLKLFTLTSRQHEDSVYKKTAWIKCLQLLIPWSRIITEKQIISQLVKKLPA
jgi:hypothetical protein